MTIHLLVNHAEKKIDQCEQALLTTLRSTFFHFHICLSSPNTMHLHHMQKKFSRH